MLVVRPIGLDDLNRIVELAVESGVGMTSLPTDQGALHDKIEESLEGFQKKPGLPGGESYLFVLEDTDSGRVVGTCGMVATLGTTKPFYTYKLVTLVHASEALKIYRKIETLQLVNDYTGASEVGSLYLTPEYRKDGNGRLLSRCRFLFLAEFMDRFQDLIIAEMRGVQDATGHSPFWGNLGRHFFDMNFSRADYLTAVGNKQFIQDLMPRYPIYVTLLPEEARKVIGRVHEKTEPALEMLRREGFRYRNYVDIFDAGPTVEAEPDRIRTVRRSQKCGVETLLDEPPESEAYILSNANIDYRACLGTLTKNPDNTVTLGKETAAALRVKKGDLIRFVPYEVPRLVPKVPK